MLLSGMIAGIPHQGGATWAVLQYLLGLKRLGHEVYFVEPVQQAALRPSGAPLARTANATHFRRVIAQFGLEQDLGTTTDGHAADGRTSLRATAPGRQ